jgi:hypothetical protein
MKNLMALVLILCTALMGCVTISGDVTSLLDKPVIKAFSANPSVISQGDASTLSWTVTGANNVSIDQGVGSVALNGSTTISPQATTTYIVTANNAAGNSTARCQVTVRGTQPAASQPASKPVINSFKADPSSLVAGGSSTLSWDVQGATLINISPDIGPVEPGITLLVSPAQTTMYTLSASNSAGSESASLTVAVRQAEQTQLQGGNKLDLPLVISESGSLIKSGSNYGRSGTVCVGDTPSNLPSRAFLSFDISSIPANSVIEEAVLDMGTYAISGNPVYSVSGWGNMGALEVYQYQYGPTADMGRLGYEFPAPSAGSFKLIDTSISPLKMDVTLDSSGNNVIQGLLAAGQQRCQFRLQFFTSTNWDSKADMVCVETAVLRVKYSVAK